MREVPQITKGCNLAMKNLKQDKKNKENLEFEKESAKAMKTKAVNDLKTNLNGSDVNLIDEKHSVSN